MRQSDGRLHISTLVNMAKTPRHVQHYAAHGLAESRGLELGRAVHLLALTESGEAPPIVYPGPVRRGKEWDAFRATHQGAEIITRSEMADAEAIADGLRSDRLAMTYLGGTHELKIQWEWCGVPCSGAIDVWNAGEKRLVDLKTCPDASPARFRWAARDLCYAAKMAWYRNGLILSGHTDEVREVALVVVPSGAPHIPAVYRISEYDLDEGLKACRAWIERWKVCRDAGVWPGWGEEPMDIQIYDTEDELDWGGVA